MAIIVSVDIGYGFVKAISSSGRRVLFPSLVGRGYERTITDIFSDEKNQLSNMQIIYKNENWFVGELANESRSLSRVFQRERFEHLYTHILLNVAIQLVTEKDSGPIYLATGLPLDFYKAQAKSFQGAITGSKAKIEWLSGVLKGQTIENVIEKAIVFPQGASAVFAALINHEGKYVYPQYMIPGSLIALIDIGFRTTDYVVVEIQENGSFAPKAKLSGTVDHGVVNLHRDVRQAFKAKSGGADLNEFFLNRVLKDKKIRYKGQEMDFSQIIEESQKSIIMNIADRLKNVWGDESDLFDALFLAGGGGSLFEPLLQPHFDNRLINVTESQFANAIGYFRLGKSVFEKTIKN